MEGKYLIGESSRLLWDFSIGFSIIVFVYSSYLLGLSTSSQIGFSLLEFTSFAGKLRIEGGAGCANGGWKFCDLCIWLWSLYLNVLLPVHGCVFWFIFLIGGLVLFDIMMLLLMVYGSKEALRMSIWDKCGWNLLSGLLVWFSSCFEKFYSILTPSLDNFL